MGWARRRRMVAGVSSSRSSSRRPLASLLWPQTHCGESNEFAPLELFATEVLVALTVDFPRAPVVGTTAPSWLRAYAPLPKQASRGLRLVVAW